MKDDEKSEEKLASFRLSRIQSIEDRFNHKFILSKEQKTRMKEILMDSSQLSYLIGENKKITVRLTANGYHLFSKIIISGRPSFIDKKIYSDDDIRVDFYCTEEQIYQYFLRFGADAEIIAPPELRNRFGDTYRKPANYYITEPPKT